MNLITLGQFWDFKVYKASSQNSMVNNLYLTFPSLSLFLFLIFLFIYLVFGLVVSADMWKIIYLNSRYLSPKTISCNFCM